MWLVMGTLSRLRYWKCTKWLASLFNNIQVVISGILKTCSLYTVIKWTDMKNKFEENNCLYLKLKFSLEHDDKCKIKFLDIK